MHWITLPAICFFICSDAGVFCFIFNLWKTPFNSCRVFGETDYNYSTFFWVKADYDFWPECLISSLCVGDFLLQLWQAFPLIFTSSPEPWQVEYFSSHVTQQIPHSPHSSFFLTSLYFQVACLHSHYSFSCWVYFVLGAFHCVLSFA